MHEVSEASLIKDFVNISRYAGSRFDLVQASGGNTSVKLDENRLLVKASGVHLSEINAEQGYVSVEYPRIVEILDEAYLWSKAAKHEREAEAGRLVAAATNPMASGARASIEVFLHAILRKFVLHTHPLAVNMITCRSNWLKQLTAIFPDALFVPYATPGIELGVLLKTSLEDRGAGMVSIPQIIFLQNHGLIVNCENMEDALKLTEEVVLKCEKLCEVDLAKYRATTELIKYIGDDLVAYLSEDCILHNLLRKNGNFSSQKPSVPDTFVFCGVAPLDLKNLESQKPLQDYRDRFHDNPKIIIFDERCYFLAKNIKKAKEIEDVFKAHVLVLSSLQLDCAFLSDDEIAYLGNWEAEKYRMEK